MMNLFKKKSKQEVILAPETKKLDSLFSTHIETPEILDDDAKELVVSNVFKRTINDFRPVNSKGKAVKGAMDSVGGGNPNAFKPQLQDYGNVPFVQLQWYANQTFPGYQVLGIIAQNWLVDKACTMPGRDAMRHGYRLTMNDGEKADPAQLDEIKQLDKQYEVTDHAVQFVRKNRIFGIRIALFKIETNDLTFYEKPFNIDGVKPGSYKGIVQVDPYWITPELDSASAADPSSLHFYEPTWWRINGIRYHRTHLVIIKNGEVVDILKPTYLYGGISVPQKIAERVYAAERTANEAPMLAMTKRSIVWHMNMEAAIANQAVFQQKMNWFTRTMSNFGVKAMGVDDVAEQFDTSLADLDNVIMTQYQLVASIADVPATELLGTSPKGFNATGDYEAESYTKFLESVQRHDIQPLLERHYELLFKSEGINLDIQIVWNPADSPSGEELAQINLIKAQVGNALVTSGAIDGVDERARIIADENSGYSGIPDAVPEPPDDDESNGDQDR